MMVLEVGTVGALECDSIGIKQALVQTVIFGMASYITAKKGGIFNDNM